MSIDYEQVQREWRRLKGNLTRATGAGDDLRIIAVCQDAEASFSRFGFPDRWALFQRAYDDAALRITMSNPFH